MEHARHTTRGLQLIVYTALLSVIQRGIAVFVAVSGGLAKAPGGNRVPLSTPLA